MRVGVSWGHFVLQCEGRLRSGIVSSWRMSGGVAWGHFVLQCEGWLRSGIMKSDILDLVGQIRGFLGLAE